MSIEIIFYHIVLPCMHFCLSSFFYKVDICIIFFEVIVRIAILATSGLPKF